MTTVPPRRTVTVLAVLLCAWSPVRADSADDWQFSVTPYLWAAGVAGNVGADGTQAPPIESDYNFFSLANLDAAAFLGFSAGKGRWTLNADYIRIGFSDDFDLGPLNTGISLDADALELSAGYRLADWENTQLVFGTRGISIDAGISFTPGPDSADSRTWWDPIVGVQHRRSFGEHWGLLLRGDIGGFNVSSKITFNGVVAGTYRFNDLVSVLFGYRYLTFDFRDDDFVTDLEVYGYAIGLRLSW